jgi:hypothetical protein
VERRDGEHADATQDALRGFGRAAQEGLKEGEERAGISEGRTD